MDRDRLRNLAGIALAVVVVAAFGLSRMGGIAGVGDDPAPTCEDPVAWHDASLRDGQRTAVSGRIAGVGAAPEAGGAPTFLNLGNAHPEDERLDVVIYDDVAERFDVRPGPAWEGRHVCVQGRLRDRDGVLQIILEDPAYLTSG